MKGLKKDLLIGYVIVVAVVATLFFCGGCTTRYDAGRILGLGFNLSVGEDSTFTTTAQDKSQAGETLVGHKPAPEAAAERASHRPANQQATSEGASWDTRF